MKILLSAILEGLTSRADRTWKITFGTQELKGSEVERLNSVLRQEVAILIAKDENIKDKYESVDIKEVVLDRKAGDKSPSERLRNVLHVYFTQQGSRGDFDSYYKARIENFIEQIKDRLEPN